MRPLLPSFAAVVLLSGSWACVGAPPGSNGATGGGGIVGGGGGQTGFGGGGGGFIGGDGGGGGPGCFHPQDLNPVAHAWRTPPPVSGGTMAVLADGTAAIADSDRDELHFIGIDFAVRHLALQPGDEPGRVVEGPAGTVFVALRRGGAVAQVDVSALTSRRFAVCPAPRGLAWRDAQQQLVVACSDGELATIDFASGVPVTTTRRAGADLRDVVVMNGQVLVTAFRSAQVYALDAQGTLVPWGRPSAVTDAAHDLQPEVAWRAVVAPRGLLMAHQRADTAAVPASSTCFSPWGSSPGVSTTSTLSPALSVLNAGGQTAELPGIPSFALPVDVATSADGNRVALVFAGTQNVAFWDPNNQSAPSAVVVDGLPVSVAYRGDELLVYSREPARLYAYDAQGNVTTQLPLSTLSMDDTGHDLFHRQTSNGIACASCHPEATEDGHVWNLPNGLRRTPSLRGGIKGTEPFHWDGEESTMATLVSDVLVDRMGGNVEDADHSSALLDWIDGQPKRPAPADLDTAAVARGEAAFSALGCGTCLSGALGTNNSSTDVGTGAAFQVPRLVEVAYRAPFFHDGHVATLEDRFTSAGGSAHTATQGLTADQIADLVAYLKSR